MVRIGSCFHPRGSAAKFFLTSRGQLTVSPFLPDSNLLHGELTGRIIGCFYDVYNELGFGFLESVYHNAMLVALKEIGLGAASRVKLPVFFRGRPVGDFEADILVEMAVILELKAADSLASEHEAQLLNYLKATPVEVGLLLNFGPKPKFKRLAFDNDRKRSRPPIERLS